jgi:hypothetical protein
MRTANTINLIAGTWLFISPWVYGAYTHTGAWNSWIIGAAIAILAAGHLRSPSQTWMSWINCLLGVWVFISPWVYGYTSSTGRFINSLCVGVVVFVFSLIAANAAPRRMVTRA